MNRIILIAILALSLTACTTTADLLAEAQACGLESECDNLWLKWNRAETRAEERRLEKAWVKQCNDSGGIVLLQSQGSYKTKACVSKRALQEALRRVQ